MMHPKYLKLFKFVSWPSSPVIFGSTGLVFGTGWHHFVQAIRLKNIKLVGLCFCVPGAHSSNNWRNFTSLAYIGGFGSYGVHQDWLPDYQSPIEMGGVHLRMDDCDMLHQLLHRNLEANHESAAKTLWKKPLCYGDIQSKELEAAAADKTPWQARTIKPPPTLKTGPRKNW